MSVKDKLKDLPDSPGVYIMEDAGGAVIYIGKAKKLKNRVRQYFTGRKDNKVEAMVSHVADFRYIITKTEVDALILEANLIKKHKPHYNILLKDDKNYPYIKIDLKSEFPAFEITRKLKRDKAKYFGPFMGVGVRDLTELLCELYPLRTCNKSLFALHKKRRPCLDFDIGKCSAPCADKITPERYAETVGRLIKFLEGGQREAEDILSDRMGKAVLREDFETAVQYREKLKILDKLKYKKVAALSKDANMDIFAYASDGNSSVISQLILRGGKIVGAENFNLPESAVAFGGGEVFSAFLPQYYRKNRPPEEIILNEKTPDADTLGEYLRGEYGKKVLLFTPQKGIKKELADTAYVNARDYLEKSKEQSKRRDDMTAGAAELLQKILNLPRFPNRIECYDISNISGVDKVASMAVFTNGAADRAAYRRFKIRTVEGADDFASMAEVLSRRFARLKAGDERFGLAPDLIVLDGGKGQLSAGLAAKEEAGADVAMISLAKKFEHIFTPHSSEPVILDKNNLALKMLIRLRDETHRFAITYFRKLHGKTNLTSVLDGISGIGEERKRELVRHFKSVSKIKSAAVKELCAVRGISQKTAEKIYNYFNPEESKK